MSKHAVLLYLLTSSLILAKTKEVNSLHSLRQRGASRAERGFPPAGPPQGAPGRSVAVPATWQSTPRAQADCQSPEG